MSWLWQKCCLFCLMTTEEIGLLKIGEADLEDLGACPQKYGLVVFYSFEIIYKKVDFY